MGFKKARTNRVSSVFQSHIGKNVKIKTKDRKIHEGYIEKIDNENVYVAVPRTKKAEKKIKTNGNRFRRRHFTSTVVPLTSIGAFWLD